MNSTICARLLPSLSLAAAACTASPNPPPPLHASPNLVIADDDADTVFPASDPLEVLAWEAPLAGPALEPQPTASVWEIGAAGGISIGDGEPSNDMTTYGLFARRRLDDGWALRLTLEQSAFDFERPAKILGITQDTSVDTVDADALSTTVLAWIERTYWSYEGTSEWFLGAGLGLSSVDVDDAQGPVQGGGTFDIETDAGTEVVGALEVGYRWHVSDRWTLEALARGEQHFADWEMEDRVSGAKGSVDDYTLWAFLVGISFGF